MDLLPQEEVQNLTITSLLKQSISIPSKSPRTFTLLTLTLIFPLSFAILAHTLITHPLITQIKSSPQPSHSLSLLLLFLFSYLLFLFAFSLLSTAAVVFSTASLYTSKHLAFSSVISALPSILKRLFLTFIWVFFLMFMYNLVFVFALLCLFVAVDTDSTLLFFVALITLFFLFLFVHVYITALWHLASVVSVLEPIYGLAAMRKSRELLKGKTQMAAVFVFGYLAACGAISGVFGSVVVHSGEEFGVWVKVLVGGVMVGLLVVVNLVGLLVQSVFYYVCKSYHGQGIDKSALYEQLGGYLGEYVPLKSSIQMESLEV
eukprot:TRINITY_DN4575_c0_g1_i1.p1 TRINITY_DN4575_c0_g1~~TRINITY_DN4575_c0_g1_i1.p1  ORF type:complete len:318 (-),score=30.90 TRINITY_DN4575_c0_g1_i1:398-1351(-)